MTFTRLIAAAAVVTSGFAFIPLVLPASAATGVSADQPAAVSISIVEREPSSGGGRGKGKGKGGGRRGDDGPGHL